ncbi:MAG: glycosyltransferase [Hellea sp.]
MICIVIPTLNCGAQLSSLLPQLRGADRIVVADGGSIDDTVAVAVEQAVIAAGAKGRGQQLALGARHALGAEWLFFIHADNQLPKDWMNSVQRHITRHPKAAGYFRYQANGKGFWPRFMEFWVGMRCQWWGLPYGDQGLLISRGMYDAVGRYPAQSLFEDVAIVDSIKEKFGRLALRPLRGHMRVDISKYDHDGTWKRGQKNLKLLKAYRKGEDVAALAKTYRDSS